MLQITPHMRLLLAVEPVDFRTVERQSGGSDGRDVEKNGELDIFYGTHVTR